MGRTPILAEMDAMGNTKGRTLLMVHRQELVRQAATTFAEWVRQRKPNATIGVEMADERAGDADYVIASVQSLSPERLKQFDAKEFGALYTDECHHSTSDSYKQVYNHFDVFNRKDILCVGVTATVNRGDGEGLNRVFQEVNTPICEVCDLCSDCV